MRVTRQPVICNAKGEPIKLTKQEQHLANHLQRQVDRKFSNTLGFQIPITTLTTVIKEVAEQKFFEIFPADFIPVRVGQGAWATSITTFRAFDLADAFETGIINQGGQNGRLAVAEVGVDALNQPIYNWAKQIGWTIFELEQAARAGDWDVVRSKEKARKRNWDLGIQRVAFLGAQGQNGAGGKSLGLLNQPGVTVNSTLITKPLKSMTPTELDAVLQNLIELYRANTNRTAWPNTFVIPESDYNGLASQFSPSFPVKTKIEVLEDALRRITRNPNFRVLPLPYGDTAFSGFTYQQYALYNAEEDSLRINVPVDYTATLANSVDNFMFQNVGYGQFSGVLAVRPLEMMYFQYTPTP